MKTDLRRAPPAKAPRWATNVATVFGVGYLGPGPGTWASAVTVVLWWVVCLVVTPGWRPWLAIGLSIVVCAIAIPAATLVERALGREDPGCVVIDEVAGQLVTFIAAPVAWQTLLAGFILFRGFDILKPPPARQFERLGGGLGIVADDVAAGVYALIVLQVLLRIKVLPH